jgi:hypothetical protein
LLWSIVNDGLGNQLVDTAVWTQMRATEFSNPAKINSEFVVNNPISDQNIVDALYNDP